MKRVTFSCASVALLMGAAAPQSRLIDLNDGQPKSVALRGVDLRYDGKDTVRVGTGKRGFRISAMVPAAVGVAPDTKYLVHNFGDGSGQVYDLRVFSLPNGKSVDVSRFKQRVLAFAHSRRICRARMDQISFLVERWSSQHSLKIGTEDWTRRPGCEHLYRKWTLALP